MDSCCCWFIQPATAMSTNRNGSRPCVVFLFKAYYALGERLLKVQLSIRSDSWTHLPCNQSYAADEAGGEANLIPSKRMDPFLMLPADSVG